jgi:hypothetical protein
MSSHFCSRPTAKEGNSVKSTLSYCIKTAEFKKTFLDRIFLKQHIQEAVDISSPEASSNKPHFMKRPSSEVNSRLI